MKSLLKKVEEDSYSVNMIQLKKQKTNLTLIVVFLFVLGIASFKYWSSKEKDSSLVFDNIDIDWIEKIDLNFQNSTLGLRKSGNQWTIAEYQSKTTLDTRANSDLIEHVLSLLKSLKKGEQGNYKIQDIQSYGIEKPELAMTFEWVEPTKFTRHPGALFFGNRDLSNKKIFVFIPQLSPQSKPQLIEVSSVLVDLITLKQPLDFRNRNVVTFDTDDVDEFTTSGKCGQISLSREGNLWKVKSKGQGRLLARERTREIHLLLKSVIESKYTSIEENQKISIDFDHLKNNFFAPHLFCTIELQGLRNRNEKLYIFEKQKKLFSVNTNLFAQYELEKAYPQKLQALLQALH